MAVFEGDEVRWTRPDYAAIAGRHGLLAVAQAGLDPLRRWLADHDYSLVELDCDAPSEEFRDRVTRLFRWKDQFGYEPWTGNLDALRDGFDFEFPAAGGLALELKGFARLWAEDQYTARVFLELASEYTHISMTSGRRFLTLIGVPEGSQLEGETIGRIALGQWWLPGGAFVPGDQ